MLKNMRRKGDENIGREKCGVKICDKMRLEQSGLDNLREYAKILKKTARYKDFGVYLSALVRDIVFDREDISSWWEKYRVDDNEAINLIENALSELEVLA